MSDLVLRMTDVYRVHGSGPTAVRALDGVSLSVQAGELVQAQLVQGPNGGAMGLAHPTAVELKGQADVLGGGERGDEVEVLEDHTDPAAAQGG